MEKFLNDPISDIFFPEQRIERETRIALNEATRFEENRLLVAKLKRALRRNEALLDALNELDSLAGLSKVKSDIKSLVDFVKVQSHRKRGGKKVPDMTKHLVFIGNPGTGKTTVARLVGRIFYALEVCRTMTFIETDRAGLVASYIGQTALKTKEKIASALGGVLFIDEAYTLAPKGYSTQDFGLEAIACLLKEMEDHRDDLVVIVAGYPDEMKAFISSNPGLESRFSRKVYFDDYSGLEMMQIFTKMCQTNDYRIHPDATLILRCYFDSITDSPISGFANGRTVRNLFEALLRIQSSRVAKTLNTDCLNTDLPISDNNEFLDFITSEDVKQATANCHVSQ